MSCNCQAADSGRSILDTQIEPFLEKPVWVSTDLKVYQRSGWMDFVVKVSKLFGSKKFDRLAVREALLENFQKVDVATEVSKRVIPKIIDQYLGKQTKRHNMEYNADLWVTLPALKRELDNKRVFDMSRL